MAPAARGLTTQVFDWTLNSPGESAMATSIPPDAMSPVLLMLMVTPALLVPGAAVKATDVGVATSLAARRMLAVKGTVSVTPP